MLVFSFFFSDLRLFSDLGLDSKKFLELDPWIQEVIKRAPKKEATFEGSKHATATHRGLFYWWEIATKPNPEITNEAFQPLEMHAMRPIRPIVFIFTKLIL